LTTNMALYFECRINKNALLRTPSDCFFFGDFAYWDGIIVQNHI